MPRPTVNLAAGRRYLGARRHARQLNHQVEAVAAMESIQAEIVQAVQTLVEAHRRATRAKGELVEANRIASGALYEAPAEASTTTPVFA